MTTERIKEIQLETAYPNSVSVQQALLKVWNECEQERMYSEKEVKKIVCEALESALVTVDLEQWFKQFKKN